jgi:hypothetical protein
MRTHGGVEASENCDSGAKSIYFDQEHVEARSIYVDNVTDQICAPLSPLEESAVLASEASILCAPLTALEECAVLASAASIRQAWPRVCLGKRTHELYSSCTAGMASRMLVQTRNSVGNAGAAILDLDYTHHARAYARTLSHILSFSLFLSLSLSLSLSLRGRASDDHFG